MFSLVSAFGSSLSGGAAAQAEEEPAAAVSSTAPNVEPSAVQPASAGGAQGGMAGGDEVAVVDVDLRRLLSERASTGRAVLSGFSRPIESFVQPASIDLPLGPDCILVKQKCLPF